METNETTDASESSETDKTDKRTDASELGYVGLGRIGGNMVRNLLDHKVRVVAYDINRGMVADLLEERKVDAEEGRLKGAYCPEGLIACLEEKPRIVWLMINAGRAIDTILSDIALFLSPGDIIIDGGNSYFHDSMRRAEELRDKGIYFLDVGTSGGVKGAREGACLTIGGSKETYESLEHIFRKMAAPAGYLYVGGSGSGHFVKMVHNLIEYGIERCLGEGMELLEAGEKLFTSGLDLRGISHLWNHGSIIESKLLGNLAEALGREDFGKDLTHIYSRVGGGETGEWGIRTAMELGVPVPATAAALFERYCSRREESLGTKCVAAMRNVFGKHPVEYKIETQK